MTPKSQGERAWEVERDRFGVLFSGPLEVGECIEVCPVAERDAAREERDEAQRRAESFRPSLREMDELRQEAERLRGALAFYADPESYFAVGIFADPPCGKFADDFSETDMGERPGRRAREALQPPDGTVEGK